VYDIDDGLDDANKQAHGDPDDLVAAVEADPDTYREALRQALSAADAEQDQELVRAARRVLELADPDGVLAGKYQIQMRGSTGVQIGDANTMTLNLNDQHPRRR
jgi:hypothetical protein